MSALGDPGDADVAHRAAIVGAISLRDEPAGDVAFPQIVKAMLASPFPYGPARAACGGSACSPFQC
jgi:hypothetical protein